MTTKAALLAMPALFLCGCNVEYDPGPSQRESKAIELDKIEVLRAQVKMPVGEMRIRGGSAKLMEGDFEFRPVDWKTEVRDSSSGFRGNLVIEHPRGNVTKRVNNSKNEWDLKFNDKVPTDFEFNLGVGEADINLASMMIRGVEVKMGVGELNLDLRGRPDKDYSVRVKGGIGEAKILLPPDTAVVAYARGGIGGVDAEGMIKRDGRWVNEAYDRKKSTVTVRVDVEGGIGHIQLICE